MPIHDLTYRHWSGSWTSHPYRWWVITRQVMRLLAGKKRFLFLMILSALPFLVRAVILYLSTVLGRLDLLEIDAGFFKDFLTQQMFFTFIISIYAGAGLIANDLKANALQIYLSKPITRGDYIIGKLGGLVFFLALPTLLPALLLLLLAVAFKADMAWFESHYWIAAPIMGYSLIIILTHAFLMLALSSLSRSARFAGIFFAAVLFFTQILFGILRGILRTTRVAWVSIYGNIGQAGDYLFGLKPQYQSPVWLSVLILIGLILAGAWIVRRRVRAVEVVK